MADDMDLDAQIDKIEKALPGYEKFDHGPLQTFQIGWKDGSAPTLIEAHQVLLPRNPIGMGFGGGGRDPFFTFHGEIDGKWRFLLAVGEDRVEYVRNVTELGVV